MPVTYACLTEQVGVREESASMGALVGANFNNDGTALYECVAVVFIAQVYGIELGLTAAWWGPQGALISNDEVASFVAAAPDRLVGVLSQISERSSDLVAYPVNTGRGPTAEHA